MANKQRDPQREATWRRLLAKHAASGLSVRVFCQQEQLTESAFYAWRRTIDERNREVNSSRAPFFVPAVVAIQSPREASIAIELAGGCVLRMSGATAPEQLADLVVALQARGDR